MNSKTSAAFEHGQKSTGEIEERILTHPGVAECAVIGLPDAK